MPGVLRTTCWLLRVALGLLLLYSGAIKLARPYEFLHAVFQYRVFGGTGATIFAAVLPIVELTLALALLAGVCAAGATLIAAILFASFAIAQCATLMRGIVADCGCFGPGETIGVWTVARTITLFAVAVACCVRETSRLRPSDWRTSLTVPEPTGNANPHAIAQC